MSNQNASDGFGYGRPENAQSAAEQDWGAMTPEQQATWLKEADAVAEFLRENAQRAAEQDEQLANSAIAYEYTIECGAAILGRTTDFNEAVAAANSGEYFNVVVFNQYGELVHASPGTDIVKYLSSELFDTRQKLIKKIKYAPNNARVAAALLTGAPYTYLWSEAHEETVYYDLISVQFRGKEYVCPVPVVIEMLIDDDLVVLTDRIEDLIYAVGYAPTEYAYRE